MSPRYQTPLAASFGSTTSLLLLAGEFETYSLHVDATQVGRTDLFLREPGSIAGSNNVTVLAPDHVTSKASVTANNDVSVDNSEQDALAFTESGDYLVIIRNTDTTVNGSCNLVVGPSPIADQPAACESITAPGFGAPTSLTGKSLFPEADRDCYQFSLPTTSGSSATRFRARPSCATRRRGNGVIFSPTASPDPELELPSMRRWVAFCLLLPLLPAAEARADVQVTDDFDSIQVTSTTPVVLASLTVRGSGVQEVALGAHVHAGGSGLSLSQYEIGISRDTTAGTLVGNAVWEPPTVVAPSINSFQGTTIFVTGFESGVTLPASYVVWARKLDAGSADMAAGVRGFDAQSDPDPKRVAGFYDSIQTPADEIPIDSTSWIDLGSLAIQPSVPSAVVLRGHVTLSGNAFTLASSYEVGICIGSAGGTLIGLARWRPAQSTSVTNTVGVTGFESISPGARTYVLCARKLDSGAPNLTARDRGLQAVASDLGTATGSEATSDTPLPLDSSSFAEQTSVSVTATARSAVWLTGHLYLEGALINSNNVYDVAICRGSPTGPMVGAARWQPTRFISDAGVIGDTTTLTGFDVVDAGTTSYALCAAKFGDTPTNLSALLRGLVATVPEPGAAAAPLAALAGLAALRGRPPGRGGCDGHWK